MALAGLTLAVLTLAGTLAGQQAPVFQSHSDLVQIPVTVLDRHGHFVGGLGKYDFHVQVDGKPVALVSVDRQQMPAVTTALPTPPLHVYSNDGASRPAQRLVLLLDYEHTPVTDLPFLRSQMMKWFRHDLPAGEQVAVFALDGGLEVLQTFTSDRTVLEATMDHIVHFHSNADRYAGVEQEIGLLEGFGASAGDGPGDAPVAAGGFDSAAGLGGLQEMLQRGQYADTMHGLENLAEVLEGVPGRKSVIWLTTRTSLNGLFNPKLALSGNLRDQAFGHLNQADVALFPLDVSGLKTFMPPMNARVNARHPLQGQSRMMQANAREHMAMSWAANSTGGEAYFDTNGFGQVLTRVIEASAETYVVSFLPPPARKGHAYRDVKVEVPAAKDARLLYRRQYLQPDIRLADRQSDDLAGQVARLALTPVEMGGLRLAVKTSSLQMAAPPSHAPAQMDLAMVMPYQPVIHADIDNGNTAGFDFSVVRILIPLDDPARVLVAPPGRFQRKLSAQDAQTLDARAMVYRAHLEIPPGHLYLARLIVRDNLTGTMGTVSFRIDSREGKTGKQ